MAVLLIADVNEGHLATDQVAKALAAVAGLGEVHVLVAGTGGDAAAAEAATLQGVAKVLFADDHAYCHGMAESTAALEKTVELDPQYARAWYNLGLARNGANQPLEAINALRRAESADPSDSAIPYARATIHARIGQQREAAEAAARALQLRPEFMEARQLLQNLSR